MRKLILLALFAFAPVVLSAQTSEDLRREIERYERAASQVLDTVSVYRFDASYIGEELWVNDFAQYYQSNQEPDGEWAAALKWMLPEGLVDGKDSMEVSDESISIDLFGRTDVNFSKLAQRLKAHGFTADANEETAFGVHLYEAHNAEGNRQCAVSDFGNNHYQITIEKCQTDEEVMRSLLERAGMGSHSEELMNLIRSLENQ